MIAQSEWSILRDQHLPEQTIHTVSKGNCTNYSFLVSFGATEKSSFGANEKAKYIQKKN